MPCIEISAVRAPAVHSISLISWHSHSASSCCYCCNMACCGLPESCSTRFRTRPSFRSPPSSQFSSCPSGHRRHYRDIHLASDRLESAGSADLRPVRDLVSGGRNGNAGRILEWSDSSTRYPCGEPLLRMLESKDHQQERFAALKVHQGSAFARPLAVL